mmetsp:Transcript_27787/g.31216  ORF Transcript_27787/g.31216 Transcript_27787/m.31216 type:complete len:325 (+) Transcript_27787:261-1235(+)
MTLESFIPLKCCIAPEIPTAIYKSGATTFPVCPTCQSLGQNPASTAALEAPTAAPNLSASASRIGKLSPLLMPRPPLTTMLALPKSGRSDFDTDSPIHLALSNAWIESTVSTDEQSTRSALSKHVGRIDNTFRSFPFGLGCAMIFAKTLPAYIGRMNVFSSKISRISVTGETSNRDAALGRTVLPNLLAVPITILQSSPTISTIAFATVSLSLSSIGTWKMVLIPEGILVGSIPPTTNRLISFPLFNFVAAVTVDCVPAGVFPSMSSGSDRTNVEADILCWYLPARALRRPLCCSHICFNVLVTAMLRDIILVANCRTAYLMYM